MIIMVRMMAASNFCLGIVLESRSLVALRMTSLRLNVRRLAKTSPRSRLNGKPLRLRCARESRATRAAPKKTAKKKMLTSTTKSNRN